MRIGILGTGGVGRTLAAGVAALGHDVVVGTRDPESTLARSEPDGSGGFADWLAQHPEVGLASMADAAAHGEVVVNATNGAGTLAALQAAGAERLGGKPLLDVSNPLDFSHGFPPTLTVKDTDSLAETVQRAFPDARVVKSLNTVTAELMVAPERLAAGAHSMFVAGDDPEAKAVVRGLLRELGWVDVLDLGDLTAARGMEMWLPLWLRLFGTLGTAEFNLSIVR
jgi:hypothetical protein